MSEDRETFGDRKPAGRVLLVEDDEGLRRLLGRAFRRAGIELEEAAKGEEALELVAARPPDLLVLDYGLPDLDGATVIDRLAEAGRGIPFVVITGQGSEEVAVELLRRGARDYLVKDPDLPEQLVARVELLLAQLATERRLEEAERALRLSEEKHRRLVENLGDRYFLYEHDRDGIFTFVSSSVHRVLGTPPEELPGHYGKLMTDHPANEAAHRHTEASLRGERQPPYLVEVHHADGSPRRLEIQEVPVRNGSGEVVSVEGIARDVTEELAAAETLRIQSTALEAAASAVVITDTAGTIVWVNRAFCEVTGYDRKEVLGRNPRLLRSGEHDAAFYRELWETISSGRVWEGELVNRRKDGTLIRELMSISPVRDEAGAIRHFVGVKRDVTHERELEGRLRQAQRMEAVGRLAGGIAHDFNNILTVISGFVQLASESLPADAPGRDDLAQVGIAAERAATLVGQLLAFSRRQVFQPRPIHPNRLVEGVEKMLRRVLGEDLELVADLDPAAPAILADSGQLEQVLLNLAVNARDAMPRGGTLTIRTRGVDAATWAGDTDLARGEHLLLEVRDTGTGMDEETLSRIFEPFFTTKEPGRGTGLGLASVYGIVKQSGGHVRALSTPGQGSSFQILLPAARQGNENSSGTSELAERVPSGRRELILLVEDDPALLDLGARWLRSGGYRVQVARSGREALDLADHQRDIRLVVTDVVMPEMSGPELVEQLSRRAPELTSIFVSGHASDILAAHGVQERDIVLLHKPFTRSELLRTVSLALGESARSDTDT